MGFLIDFLKLFGKKIISSFVWIYIYCFLVPLNSNIFMCSYLSIKLSGLENNMSLLFLLFTTTIIVFFFKNIKYSNNKINNYINFKYLNFYFKNLNLLYILNIYISNLYINFKNILSIYIYKFYIIFLNNIFLKIKNSTLLWYPIYKSYSIFGYYKSTRLKFVDLKNENLKRLKY